MKSIRSIIIRSILCFGLFFQLTIVKDLDKILQQYFPEKYTALQQINSGAETRISHQLLLAGNIDRQNSDKIIRDSDCHSMDE